MKIKKRGGINESIKLFIKLQKIKILIKNDTEIIENIITLKGITY